MTTLDLVRGLRQKDQIGEVAVTCRFVRDDIRYVGDVFNVETLQPPADTLLIGQGDCDDKATLVASMLISIGYPVQFAVLERDRDFVHVWTQVGLFGDWYDLETTEPIPAGCAARFLDGDQLHYFEVTGL
jgi:transglutaminase-like putative cysteine protease